MFSSNQESLEDVDPLAVTENDDYDDITELADDLYPECQVDKEDTAEDVILDDPANNQEDNLGEGGTFIQGNLSLSSNVRSALFSDQLDSLITDITCSACSSVVTDFSSWREHCRSQHSHLPGYEVNLVPVPPSDRKNVGTNECPKCKLNFLTQDERNEHVNKIVRTVRLVCPQCEGQFSNLEEHVKNEHNDVEYCGFCGLETKQITVHCHTLHQGFNSVLSELTVSCAGDKLNLESFESVFITPSTFLATEVKPSAPDTEEVIIQAPKPSKQNNLIIKSESSSPSRTSATSSPSRTSATSSPSRTGISPSPSRPDVSLANLPNRLAVPLSQLGGKHNDVSRLDWKKGWGPIGLSRGGRSTNIQLEESRQIRERNNEEDFKRFMLSGGAPNSHDCEICGFQPYTKNRYRERQDHLVRIHFKERIDQLIPIEKNYNCPMEGCDYTGKDRQDILRHYTGKHNILKLWVLEFIKEQMQKNKELLVQADKDKLITLSSVSKCTGDKGMTFAEMQAKANASRELSRRQLSECSAGWRRSSKMTGADQLQQTSFQRIRLLSNENSNSNDGADSLGGFNNSYIQNIDDDEGVDPLENRSTCADIGTDISSAQFYQCQICSLKFTSTQALSLHAGICSSTPVMNKQASSNRLLAAPSSTASIRLLAAPSSTITTCNLPVIATDSIAHSMMDITKPSEPSMNNPEPPKKKARRPPPPLVKI